MAGTITERARDLWRTWVTRGSAPRTLPPEMLRAVYGLWIGALVLKLLGSSWDVSWHFTWLRDDLAPPHLLNSAGTAVVIALVAFHTWTGYGVDRPTLRFMQTGIAIFLVAVPVDVINHRVNGLDITAWSPTHAMLYLGSAVMLAGVIRGWWLYGTGRLRLPVLVLLWTFALENVWFPALQQEYGVLSVAAWNRGKPEAEQILLDFAAQQIGKSEIDTAGVLHFALPVPEWLYPFWLVGAAGFVLVLARWMVGRRWTATAVVGGYLAYRCVTWLLLVGVGFPASALPFLLLGVGVAVDVAFLVPLPEPLRPVVGSVLVGVAALGTQLVQAEQLVVPPTDPLGFVAGTLLLMALWIATLLLVRSRRFVQWTAEH